jgi:NADP-dependent 3-hydroxy acid dehydrogenase YdfG
MKPVCLVIGAGAGIGGNVAAKIRARGVSLGALCRRSDEDGLNRMVS